jgi:2-polyprenyl-6-methoxyphenol hydroxylase-like FAD-dependent oxidoreductase
MDKEFDVVVVGGRCAGSPLATLLARAGLSVALVEQATFPRDTLSTHVFESAALAFLNRLGVLSALRATGAPIVNHFDIRQEGFRAQVPAPQQPGDVGGAMSVRRLLLDPILAEAAAEAGAGVWMGAKVTALVRDRGRVTGVRVAHNGSEQSLGARLVVGADGRNSTVARLAGSRKYNLTPNERFFYWSFFEDAGEHYWLATDLGKAGLAPAVLPEIARRLYERGKLDSFNDLFNHRSVPSKVLTPPRLLAATARLLARGGCDRRALLGEVGGLIAQDARRKRLARHPRYVPLEASMDAGPTEVEDDHAVGLR